MKQDLPIKFAHITRVMAVEYPEGYKFFKPKKYAWLARKLWRALEKLHALQPWFHKFEVATYGNTEQKNLSDAIFKQIDYILRDGRNIEDFAIVVGGSTFNELTGMKMFQELSVPLQMMRYYERRPENKGLYEYRYTYRGLYVHVNPYMEGIALIPRVILEEKPKGIEKQINRQELSPYEYGLR